MTSNEKLKSIHTKEKNWKVMASDREIVCRGKYQIYTCDIRCDSQWKTKIHLHKGKEIPPPRKLMAKDWETAYRGLSVEESNHVHTPDKMAWIAKKKNLYTKKYPGE